MFRLLWTLSFQQLVLLLWRISAHRLTAGFQTLTNEKTVGFREGCLKETGAYEGLFGSGSRAQIMIWLQKSDHVRNRPDCGDFTRRVGGDEDVQAGVDVVAHSRSWILGNEASSCRQSFPFRWKQTVLLCHTMLLFCDRRWFYWCIWLLHWEC